MKKFLLSFSIIALVGAAAFAQNKNTPPTKDQVEKWLPGTWVVDNKDMLPVVETGRAEYLRDSLFFLPDKVFKNGKNVKQGNSIYEYSADGGMLVVINVAELAGIQYEITSLSEDKLVFWVIDTKKGEYGELVYHRKKTAENEKAN